MALKFTIVDRSAKSVYHYTVIGDNFEHGMRLIGNALVSAKIFNVPIDVMATNIHTDAVSGWYKVDVMDGKMSNGKRCLLWWRRTGKKIYDLTFFAD